MNKKDELKFVDTRPHSKNPKLAAHPVEITEIPAPSEAQAAFPSESHEVGLRTKFVTLEYIDEVIHGPEPQEDQARKLLLLATTVRQNARRFPEHIDMLKYGESVIRETRGEASVILDYSGGIIESLVEFIKQAKAYEREGVATEDRDYGVNKPTYNSDSIRRERPDHGDRPKNHEAGQSHLEAIKRALEEYANGLEE